MTHPSKRKGNHFERQLVTEAREFGLDAKRAYASNGESLGHTAEVDCLIAGERVQAKRRKKIAAFLQVPAEVDAVVFRQDHGQTVALIRWVDYLQMLSTIERLRFDAGDDL